MLFEWNDNVDKYTEGLVKEDVVLYPSLAAEFPGITLDRHVAVPSIEEEIMPHGRAEDAAAHNANVTPFTAAGVNHGPTTIHANDNEIGEYDDEDDDIIVVADIPHGNALPQNLIAIPDSDEDVASTNGDSDSDNVDSDNDDNDGPDFQDAHHHDEEQNNEEQGDKDAPGVRHSRRKNRGQTTRYTDYGLMMAARWMARGGQRRAIICDGICCFSAEDLHGAKPCMAQNQFRKRIAKSTH